jgi:hypothetical protein
MPALQQRKFLKRAAAAVVKNIILFVKIIFLFCGARARL